MSPDDLLAAQRAAQLAADRRLARDLQRGYTRAWQRLRDEHRAVADQIQAARARGETVDVNWLIRERRLARLEERTLAEIRVFTDSSGLRIRNATTTAGEDGIKDAVALTNAQLPPIAQQLELASRALGIAAATRQGQPLAVLLDQISVDAGRAARQALIDGVAAGDGTRKIAAALREATTAPLWRTLRIARTEVIGEYRRAAIRTMRASTVVQGWTWVAELDDRTCPVCVAMHGTEHRKDEEFATHPNCRCTPVPLTVSWSDLGVDLPETRVQVESGEAWLRKQPESVQRRILGPGKLAGWKQGRFALADLVQPVLSPVWGAGRRERALRDLPQVA